MSKINKIIFFIFIIITFIGGDAVFSFASGRPLPIDAASEQILYCSIKNETGAYLDSMKTFYGSLRGMGSMLQEPLLDLNNDLEVVPLGAKEWYISEDGLTWTFYLREELKWSDGTTVTAHDYVFALQRAAAQGYDFSAYWSSVAGINKWEKVESEEMSLEELGARALDDHTLIIITETPKPFLLGILTRLYPVPRHVVQKYGDEYATRAETMVGNGPFVITEWVKGSHLTFVKNSHYNGIWTPYLEKVILKYGTHDPETGFPAYLNDEISNSDINSGQLAYVQKNLLDELYSGPMFRLFYLSFDTTKPPFDDIRVRQAFNHALDREELCSTVLKDMAIPEYSALMTGFPGFDAFEAKKLSEYNIELARKLIAEAGYPEGKGFPAQELWVRNASQHTAWQNPAATYMQAKFKEVLGVDIIPRLMEIKTYTDAFNQHTHKFFLATYGFDYMDPSNFMDLFLTGSRHAWSNQDYDRLVKEADSSYDWEKRITDYRKAEQILIEEAPAVFAFQSLFNTVWKPYIGGEGLETNKYGIRMVGDFSARFTHSNIYIKEH